MKPFEVLLPVDSNTSNGTWHHMFTDFSGGQEGITLNGNKPLSKYVLVNYLQEVEREKA